MKTNELVKQTLDKIPTPKEDAKKITGLVKQNGRVTGYKLSDDTFIAKKEAVELAKNGGIKGVAVAHRGDTEYLKAIPDGNETDNLSNLPAVSPKQ